MPPTCTCKTNPDFFCPWHGTTGMSVGPDAVTLDGSLIDYKTAPKYGLEPIPSRRYWKVKDGSVRLLTAMSDAHLEATIAFLQRQGWPPNVATSGGYAAPDDLIAEVNRRLAERTSAAEAPAADSGIPSQVDAGRFAALEIDPAAPVPARTREQRAATLAAAEEFMAPTSKLPCIYCGSRTRLHVSECPYNLESIR